VFSIYETDVLYKGNICDYQINPVINCLLNNNKSVPLINCPCYEPALTVLVCQLPNKQICTPEPQEEIPDITDFHN